LDRKVPHKKVTFARLAAEAQKLRGSRSAMEERTIEGVDEQEAAELHRQIGFDGAADARVRHKPDWHVMLLFFVPCE